MDEGISVDDACALLSFGSIEDVEVEDVFDEDEDGDWLFGGMDEFLKSSNKISNETFFSPPVWYLLFSSSNRWNYKPLMVTPLWISFIL